MEFGDIDYSREEHLSSKKLHKVKWQYSSINFDNMSIYKRDIQKIFEDINKQQDSINIAIKQAFAESKYKLERDNILSTDKKKNIDNKENFDSPSDKHKLKDELKSEVKQKFSIGDFIMLRTKSKCGSERINRVYEVKQIIWCIEDLPIQSLVVKQISGPNTNGLTMNIHDCKRLHVKYEAGLQILSMKLNWIKIKKR